MTRTKQGQTSYLILGNSQRHGEAGQVRRGWLVVLLVFVSAPLLFTLIGAFDDGEGWSRRAVLGGVLTALVAVGLLLGYAFGL